MMLIFSYMILIIMLAYKDYGDFSIKPLHQCKPPHAQTFDGTIDLGDYPRVIGASVKYYMGLLPAGISVVCCLYSLQLSLIIYGVGGDSFGNNCCNKSYLHLLTLQTVLMYSFMMLLKLIRIKRNGMVSDFCNNIIDVQVQIYINYIHWRCYIQENTIPVCIATGITIALTFTIIDFYRGR